MRRAENIISSNVLPRSAKDMALFVDISTLKTTLQHPIWRRMRWSVSALMLSMRLRTIHNPVVAMELSLLPSLVLANTQLQYLIVLSLQRKIGKTIISLTCSFTTLTGHDFESAQIARWCAESNRPLKIVTDQAFAVLMKAGRPGTTIPSPMTVSRDINSAFERCRERVDQILKVSSRSRVFFIWLIFINRNIQVMFTLELMPRLLRTTEPSSPGLSIFTMRDMCYVSSLTLLRFPRFVCYPLLLIRCLIYLWHAVSYWEDTCKRVSPHAHHAWARQQGE